MIHRFLGLLFLFLASFSVAFSQQSNSAALIKLKIDKLGTLGTALYFAAHPDDENTRLIAYLANDRKYRTAYLSLTRGDGGQNLLGTEQGIELGLIRTQELLAARAIDKGEQYFSAAYDFGFSKTHDETFSFWKKEDILREAVYLIRKLQPDVIINRFPPDSRGGHGHHQASAMLAKEAYEAAADPKRFPEQLKDLKPWKAKRIVWNTANFGGMNNTSEEQLKVVLNDYNPLMGYSYGEISAMSRSEHKSQGFGSASNRGETTEYFDHVAGEKATQDLFDGVNTTWERLAEPVKPIEAKIQEIQKAYDLNHPENSIKSLVELHKLVKALKPSVYRDKKIQDIEDIILSCAGLVAESIASKPNFVVDQEFPVNNEIIKRASNIEVKLIAIDDKQIGDVLPANETKKFEAQKSINHWTQPYWLEKPNSLGKFDIEDQDFGFPENQNNPSTKFKLEVAGLPITFEKPVEYRYVDPVRGEIHQPVSISPVLTASISSSQALLKTGEKKTISLIIKNNSDQNQKAQLSFKQTDGLTISPNQESFEIPANETSVKTFEISNPKNSASSEIQPLLNAEPIHSFKKISYQHIPDITWFPLVNLKVKALEINNPLKKIGYIHGAGDLVPSALENIGVQVDLLNSDLLASTNLKQYDAIIVGIRAYNVSHNANQWLPVLFDYVEQGGTVLAQYNVNSRMSTNKFGPYPFEINRDRVTEEDAKVTFTEENDPILNYPNKITMKDFEGWVQERGLYFASNIAPEYRTPLSMADKNEQQNKGSLLVANYGKGKFVYTSLAFFRQLPAGVPGAIRLFVNLLAKNEKN
ncbi:PIG-L family deacetylase [Sphingobacterium cellulitidis]|uniref:PIG-L family deacetylase n=1 Tax=Sphingobacterium cellulitidis TaxID=1768011 RepID=UPI000B9447E0|nr:LmbE family protein [Sphingobacterium cellulitidis]